MVSIVFSVPLGDFMRDLLTRWAVNGLFGMTPIQSVARQLPVVLTGAAVCANRAGATRRLAIPEPTSNLEIRGISRSPFVYHREVCAFDCRTAIVGSHESAVRPKF